MKGKFRNVYKFPDVPTFCVAHSMGGMVAIRAGIRDSSLFDGGVVFIGPLIIPGPNALMHVDYDFLLPLVDVIGRAAIFLGEQLCPDFVKEVVLGRTIIENITADKAMRAYLTRDDLRYFGGAPVRLWTCDYFMSRLPLLLF